jgi:hypothetical protein
MTLAIAHVKGDRAILCTENVIRVGCGDGIA